MHDVHMEVEMKQGDWKAVSLFLELKSYGLLLFLGENEK